ncbi:MAG: acyltransferase family protein, partial [Polyangiaceae bacterium]
MAAHPRPGGELTMTDAGGAFSLDRNVRALFVPPDGAGHLRPLDGVRALSILWVVVFHAGWYAAWHIPPSTYVAMLVSPAMLPVWRGDFGVDVFFVLSGFLIAGMLADEKARTGRVRLGLFYVRRLLRLWPALVVAVAADVIVIGDHRAMAWANLLYVSNFVPIASAAMGWTWSLAIEEQFYLLWPLALGALAWFTRRLEPRRRHV